MKVVSKLSEYNKNKDMVVEWSKSLQYGLDGFYEEMCITKNGLHFYELHDKSSEEEVKIGYFVIQPKETAVVAFFLLPKYQNRVDPKDIFKEMIIDPFKIRSAYCSSPDTYFLNCLLDHQKEVKVLGYSPFICSRSEKLEFSHNLDFKPFVLVDESDEARLWEEIQNEKLFIQKEEVLPMLKKKQLFYLFQKKDEKNENIAGVGVLVKSTIFEHIWSIGMYVNEKFRKQGVGTYILQNLQNICIENGKIAMAGCARENVGSRKAQQKSGMINRGSFLYIRISDD